MASIERPIKNLAGVSSLFPFHWSQPRSGWTVAALPNTMPVSTRQNFLSNGEVSEEVFVEHISGCKDGNHGTCNKNTPKASRFVVEEMNLFRWPSRIGSLIDKNSKFMGVSVLKKVVMSTTKKPVYVWKRSHMEATKTTGWNGENNKRSRGPNQRDETTGGVAYSRFKIHSPAKIATSYAKIMQLK